ncbi:hypothetical protein [Saccharopolyspora cebuensis]|uniref:Uncharacterized protein n=1 Tax=Saccharopolyspora cebuensis TaxID=418759 RepID=A0ABV4CE79_9PSEU
MLLNVAPAGQSPLGRGISALLPPAVGRRAAAASTSRDGKAES